MAVAKIFDFSKLHSTRIQSGPLPWAAMFLPSALNDIEIYSFIPARDSPPERTFLFFQTPVSQRLMIGLLVLTSGERHLKSLSFDSAPSRDLLSIGPLGPDPPPAELRESEVRAEAYPAVKPFLFG